MSDDDYEDFSDYANVIPMTHQLDAQQLKRDRVMYTVTITWDRPEVSIEEFDCQFMGVDPLSGMFNFYMESDKGKGLMRVVKIINIDKIRLFDIDLTDAEEMS